MAAQNGHLQVIRLLVEKRAVVDQLVIMEAPLQPLVKPLSMVILGLK